MREKDPARLADGKNFVNEDGDVQAFDAPDEVGFIKEEGFPHATTYARGDTPHFDDDPTRSEHSSEVSVDEVLLEGTSAAGLKRSARMARAMETKGFAPKTKRELTYFSLRDSIDSVGGGAKMMSIILQHQKNLPSAEADPQMPSRTMHAIVKDIEGFIRDSQAAESFLTLFSDYLNEFTFDETEKIGTLPLLEDQKWTQDGWLIRAVVEIKSYLNARDLAEGKTEDLPNPDGYFTRDQAIVDELDKIQHELSVKQAKELVAKAEEFQKKRREFWKNVFEEIDRFTTNAHPAGIAVRKAKAILGIDRPNAA